MTDVHDKETRSRNMSRIKGKDTKPEILVRKFLFANGFRYKLHDKKLIGKPDIVLPKYKVIVDVRGCYWHGHKNCKFGDAVYPDSLTAKKRIKDAISRDERNTKEWKKLGWNLIVIWDRCELEDKKKFSIIRDQNLEMLKNKIISTNGNTCN